MKATGSDGSADALFPPPFPPNTAQAGQSESSAVILPGSFGSGAKESDATEKRSKPMKKALSDGVSDKASKVEPKGFEPSTSALRTQRSPN